MEILDSIAIIITKATNLLNGGDGKMKTYFVVGALLLALWMPGAYAEVLKGKVSASSGIVGIDMLIIPNNCPVIKNVFPYTPASKAGIFIGDAILRVNGVSVCNLNADQVDISISNIPGDKVVFQLLRQGKIVNVSLTVAAMEEVTSSFFP